MLFATGDGLKSLVMLIVLFFAIDLVRKAVANRLRGARRGEGDGGEGGEG